MMRREFVLTGSVFLTGLSGCLSDQDAQQDSVIDVINQTDSELELSVRLHDGDSAFAVEGIVLASGEQTQFEQAITSDTRTIRFVVKILDPIERTYEQEELPTGVPEYSVRVQSDGVDVVWAEN
jgi:hypothetical protein